MVDYTGLAARAGHRRSRCSTSPRSGAAGRCSTLPAGTRGCTRRAARSSPPRAAPPRCSDLATRARRRAARPLAGHGRRRPRPRRHRASQTGDGRTRAAGVVVCADAWTNQVLAGLDGRLPLTVDARASRRTSSRSARTTSPGAMPLWIWMDDPCYYGFPSYGEATDQGGAGLRRAVVDPDAPAVRTRPRRARAAGGLRGVRCCPGPARRCGRCAASTR